jgi:hypothetical protein
MGGSAGMIGSAIRAGGGFGGKSSGRGQVGYGDTPGYTPLGQAPARTQAPVQQAQPVQQAPQYVPGSFMGGFGNPYAGFGGFGGLGGFGGKSSGLGMFGMQQSPYSQMQFNPYAQQVMQQPTQQPMQQVGGLGAFANMSPEQQAMQKIQSAATNRPEQQDTPLQQNPKPLFDYSNLRPDMLMDPSRAGWRPAIGHEAMLASPSMTLVNQNAGKFYTDPNGNVWIRGMATGGEVKDEDEE